MVRRYDRGELRHPKRLENGWLQVDGYLTRTGIFTYRNPDGTERKELRLDSVVFNRDSLASFAAVPVTNDHPPGLLDAGNTAEYVRGVVSAAPSRDGDFVRAPMTIYDADLIAAMESGKAELSCGYECELEFTPGEHDGERYDAVQRNIRGNHVAVVERGRAGDTARVRMDTGDAVQVSAERNELMKVLIDGVEYEVSEQAAQAIGKLQAAQASALTALTARADAAEGTAKVLTAKLETAEKAHTDAVDPARMDAAVLEHSRVTTDATALGVKCDGLTTKQIKAAVVKHVAKFDATDAELDAAYKVAIVRAGSEDLAAVRAATTPVPGVRTDRDAPSKARNADAWKKPIPGAMTVAGVNR